MKNLFTVKSSDCSNLLSRFTNIHSSRNKKKICIFHLFTLYFYTCVLNFHILVTMCDWRNGIKGILIWLIDWFFYYCCRQYSYKRFIRRIQIYRTILAELFLIFLIFVYINNSCLTSVFIVWLVKASTFTFYCACCNITRIKMCLPLACQNSTKCADFDVKFKKNLRLQHHSQHRSAQTAL